MKPHSSRTQPRRRQDVRAPLCIRAKGGEVQANYYFQRQNSFRYVPELTGTHVTVPVGMSLDRSEYQVLKQNWLQQLGMDASQPTQSIKITGRENTEGLASLREYLDLEPDMTLNEEQYELTKIALSDIERGGNKLGVIECVYTKVGARAGGVNCQIGLTLFLNENQGAYTVQADKEVLDTVKSKLLKLASNSERLLSAVTLFDYDPFSSYDRDSVQLSLQKATINCFHFFVEGILDKWRSLEAMKSSDEFSANVDNIKSACDQIKQIYDTVVKPTGHQRAAFWPHTHMYPEAVLPLVKQIQGLLSECRTILGEVHRDEYEAKGVASLAW